MDENTSIYDLFKTEEDLEKKGIEVSYGKAGTFTVARMGGANKRFAKALAALTAPHRRAIENETIEDEVILDVLRRVFVDTVLLGWKDVRGKDGELIPYSRANAIQLFTDLPELFMDLQEQAKKFTNFRKVLVEGDLGNSSLS